MINQKHLNTFMKLVETQHFTQTAEQLFMTQPGVTQHIKHLENHFGQALLQRYGKQFELTLAGEKLYKMGLKMQSLEQQLNEQLQSDNLYQGRCSIACSGTLANFLYPDFVTQQQAYPELVVLLEAAPNQKIINDLLSNEIDLGIVSVESAESQLTQELLGYEQLQLVVPAHLQQEWDFTQLNKLGFINHPDGLHFVDKLFTANFSEQYKGQGSLTISGYVNQLAQILLPVAQGVGFTILPERAIKQSPLFDQLQVLALPEVIKEPLYLTQKRYRQLPARYQWFVDKIKARLQ